MNCQLVGLFSFARHFSIRVSLRVVFPFSAVINHLLLIIPSRWNLTLTSLPKKSSPKSRVFNNLVKIVINRVMIKLSLYLSGVVRTGKMYGQKESRPKVY